MIEAQFQNKLDDLLDVCRKNLRTVNEDLIRKAFEFSLDAHKDDIRASGDPFFNHPYEVAMVVAKEIPLDDVSVAAALMHDVAEDTNYEIKDIRQEFGDTIADIVDGAEIGARRQAPEEPGETAFLKYDTHFHFR